MITIPEDVFYALWELAQKGAEKESRAAEQEGGYCPCCNRGKKTNEDSSSVSIKGSATNATIITGNGNSIQ